MATRLEPLSADQMRIAAAGVVPLPIEQSARWDSFEASQGRKPWGRYLWLEDDKPMAVISLILWEAPYLRYLWAKNGPVWLREATPEREAALRADLVAEVRRRERSIQFIRLHATYSAPDLRDLLQYITYDRTVIIDGGGGDEAKVLEAMSKEGRRGIRRAKKRMAAGNAEVVEDIGLTDFSEHYQVLVETAQRDGFSPHPQKYYEDFLRTLGSDHARLFSVRRDGQLLCWDLVSINDRHAVAHYGAHTVAAREVLGPEFLDFEVARRLGGEGCDGLDLMGIHSPRVPELFSVGRYKLRFAQSYTDIPGAWDVEVIPGSHRVLQTALAAKRAAVKAQRFIRERL